MQASHRLAHLACAVFAALVPVTPALAASGEEWEYRMSLMTPEGGSIPMNTVRACRSSAAALKPAPREHCKVEQFTASGSSATFRLVCGAPEPMTITGEVTRTGDSSTGTLRVRQNGQDMVVKQAARKLGGCPNPID